MFVCAHMHTHSCRDGFSLPFVWVPVISSGHQAWQQTPRPTKPPRWPQTTDFGQGGPSQNFRGEQLSEERVLWLRMCWLGQIALPAASHAINLRLPRSFVTTTFAMEAMAAANAQLRWKRMEIHKVCALPPSSRPCLCSVVYPGSLCRPLQQPRPKF